MKPTPYLRLVACAALCMSAGPCSAEWVRFMDLPDGVGVRYVDSRITTTPEAGQLLVLDDFVVERRFESSDPPHRSTVARFEFDCTQPRMRFASLAPYAGRMAQGKPIKEFAGSDWMPVKDQTRNMHLRNIACGAVPLKGVKP